MFGRATIRLGIGPHSSCLSSAHLLHQQSTCSYTLLKWWVTHVDVTKLITVNRDMFYRSNRPTKSYWNNCSWNITDLISSVSGSWVSGSQVLTHDPHDSSGFVDPFDPRPTTHCQLCRAYNVQSWVLKQQKQTQVRQQACKTQTPP